MATHSLSLPLNKQALGPPLGPTMAVHIVRLVAMVQSTAIVVAVAVVDVSVVVVFVNVPVVDVTVTSVEVWVNVVDVGLMSEPAPLAGTI